MKIKPILRITLFLACMHISVCMCVQYACVYSMHVCVLCLVCVQYACTYICMHIHAYICAYIHAYICMNMCVCTHAVCLCVCAASCDYGVQRSAPGMLVASVGNSDFPPMRSIRSGCHPAWPAVQLRPVLKTHFYPHSYLLLQLPLVESGIFPFSSAQ